MATLMWASAGHAVYILESGSANDVCEPYRDNLNVDRPKAAYSGDRPISDAFRDFRAIAWERIPDGALFPSDAIIQLAWKRDANPAWYLTFPDDWLQWKGSAAEIQKARRGYVRVLGDSSRGYAQSVSFRIARVDIDNDGMADSIVQFSPNPRAKVLLVLTHI